MKQNFKSATITTYVKGSGVENGEIKNGCEVKKFANGTYEDCGRNESDSINEIKDTFSVSDKIQTNNKMYVLVKSSHPSSDTVNSSLSIDYFNIKLEFKREPDKIESIDVEVTDKWSIQGEFYPNFESGQTSDKVRGIFDIRNVNNANRIYFELNRDGTVITLSAMLDYKGIGSAVFDVNFKKWQNIRFFLQRNKREFTACILINGELKTQKFTTNVDAITGNLKFDIGSVLGGTFYSNSFIDNFKIYNNQTFTDTEIEEMLRESKNLIPKFNEKDEAVNPFWTINPNTTVSEDGDTLTLNADSAWQFNSIKIPVFPNNKYIFKGRRTGGDCYVVAKEYYNNYELRDHFKGELNKFYHYIEDGEFTTLDNCNFLYIECGNREPGTFTFSDLELKLVQ